MAQQQASADLQSLFRRCVARIDCAGVFAGTGMFIAPGQIVTCAHVVAEAVLRGERVNVYLDEHPYTATVNEVLPPPREELSDPYPWPDVAWLTVELPTHPYVELDAGVPGYGTKASEVWSYGFAREFDRQAPRGHSGSYEVEGPSPEPGRPEAIRWQLRRGQAAYGMSGSPVLNLHSGRVLGLLTTTRDAETDLGGWAVPLRATLDAEPQLAELKGLYERAAVDNLAWREARRAWLHLDTWFAPPHEPLPPREDMTPAALLRAAHEVVPPDEARGPDVAALVAWATNPTSPPVRLITGAAGTGKTRVAVELARALRSSHWTVGFAKVAAPRAGGHDLVENLVQNAEPTLVVVDYAEARADLHDLLNALALAREGLAARNVPLRALLIARQAADWWDELEETADVGSMRGLLARRDTVELRQLSELVSDPLPSYLRAAAAFARCLGSESPVDPSPIAQTAWSFLRLHIAALNAAHEAGERHRASAASNDDRAAMDPATALSSLADRERRYWTRAARAEEGRALGLGDVDVQLLRRAVITLSLLQPADEAAAVLALCRVPEVSLEADHRVRRLLARWTRRHYPPTQAEEGYSAGIQPDLLAEHMIVDTLATDHELVSFLFTELPEAEAHSALTVLTRATRHKDNADQLIRGALVADPVRMLPVAVTVALETGDPQPALLQWYLKSHEVSDELLRTIEERLPGRTVRLRDVAAEVAKQRLSFSYLTGDDSELVSALRRYSITSARVGEKQQALEAAQEAVGLNERLAERDWDTYAFPLAQSLNNLAVRLADLRCDDEALAVARRAVNIKRERIAQGDALERHGSLAISLNNLAVRLSRKGDNEAALEMALEAVQLRSGLFTADPTAHNKASLATSLNNLAVRHARLGQPIEALAAVEKSVELKRQLAERYPDAYTDSLATALNNCAARLADAGRQDDALVAVDESIRLKLPLYQAQPDLYRPALITSFRNRRNRLLRLGRTAEAEATVEEIRRIEKEGADTE